MTFDLAQFGRANFQPRMAEVKTPELKAWFTGDGDPAFTVRGLTGEEFYMVREAAQKRRDISTIANRLVSGDGAAIAEAIEAFYGAVPDEYARRVEILVLGCVEPKVDRAAAMKLYKNFPTTAHTIAEAILRATGEGSVLGE